MKKTLDKSKTGVYNAIQNKGVFPTGERLLSFFVCQVYGPLPRIGTQEQTQKIWVEEETIYG